MNRIVINDKLMVEMEDSGLPALVEVLNANGHRLVGMADIPPPVRAAAVESQPPKKEKTRAKA